MKHVTPVHKNYFYLLDGIRGIAAVLVALRHTTLFFGTVEFQETYLAVDIFFLLSGVVLANSYEKRLQSNLPFLQFLWIRLVRLYPLYLISILVSVSALVWAPAFDGNVWLATVLGLCFIPNYTTPNSQTLTFPLNTPAWSLFCELIANLAYAIFIRVLSNRVLVGIVLTSSLGMAIALYAHYGHTLDIGWSKGTVPVGMLRVGYSFFGGVLMHRIFTAKNFSPLRGIAGAWLSLLLVGVVSAILMSSPNSSVQPYFDFFTVTVAFPLIVYAGLHVEPPHLGIRVCKVLGIISYGVYVLHAPLSYLVEWVLLEQLNIKVGDYAPWSGIVFLTSLFFLTWCLDKLYDIPVRRFLLGSDSNPKLSENRKHQSAEVRAGE
ncbi:MAG: acyltransferase family protein [Burkholderiaceae bacterium]